LITTLPQISFVSFQLSCIYTTSPINSCVFFYLFNKSLTLFYIVAIMGKIDALEGVLEQLSLSDFLPVFTKEAVDLPALHLVTESDLKDMGLPIGARRKILHWQTQEPSSISPSAPSHTPSSTPTSSSHISSVNPPSSTHASSIPTSSTSAPTFSTAAEKHHTLKVCSTFCYIFLKVICCTCLFCGR
jgi:hypothetical protein